MFPPRPGSPLGKPTFPRWTAHPPTLASIVQESVGKCEVVHTWKKRAGGKASGLVAFGRGKYRATRHRGKLWASKAACCPGDGQVVLLSGEPGIGKSRITAALELGKFGGRLFGRASEYSFGSEFSNGTNGNSLGIGTGSLFRPSRELNLAIRELLCLIREARTGRAFLVEPRAADRLPPHARLPFCAGHWVRQEQSEQVRDLLLQLLQR